MIEKDQFIESTPEDPAKELPVTEVPAREEPQTADPQFREDKPLISLKEFAAFPENKSARGLILAGAILCYVSAGITTLVLVPNQPSALVDVIILLGIGLWVHLSKSKASGVVLLVYGALNTLIMSIITHNLGGWLILLAGILALMGTSKLNEAWKKYNTH